MEATRKGEIIVTAVADPAAHTVLLAVLARFNPELSTGAREKLAAALPCSIMADVSEVMAETIIGRLEGKGIAAVFQPKSASRSAKGPSAAPSETETNGLPSPGARSGPGRRRVLLYGTTALILVAIIGLHIFSNGPRKIDTPLPPAAPFVCPAQGRPPSVLEVDPRQLQAAYACQYRLRPDRRLLAAFERMPALAAALGLIPAGRYAAGPLVLSDGSWRKPLLDGSRVAVQADLGEQPDFDTALAGLASWLNAAEVTIPAGRDGKASALAREAFRRLDAADPRALLMALGQLEALRLKNGPQAPVLAASAMALAKLTLMIEPDGLAVGDSLTARGLALLALARRLAPDLSTAREEAWLALAMGYRAAAAARLEALGAETSEADAALKAYLQRDPDRLAAIDSRSARKLAAWLHCRLLRELGLGAEATEAATQLTKDQEFSYPALVEVIATSSPGKSVGMSHVYQLRLTADLAGALPEGEVPLGTWLSVLQDLQTEGGASLSLAAFDGLLENWSAYGPATAGGVLANDELARTVLRGLYAGATELRFDALFNSLASLPACDQFLATLDGDDEPMVVLMRAQLAADDGHREEAEALAVELLNRPQLPVDMVDDTFALIGFSARKNTLGPVAAFHLDGRPSGAFEAARLHWRLRDADLARSAYELGFRLDPYAYGRMDDLAKLAADDTALQAGLARQPDNLRLHKVAGDYYLYTCSPSEPAKALSCFDQALRLAPTQTELIRGKAAALRRLGRLDEAQALLSPLLSGPDKATGMELVYARIGLAKVQLDAGRPDAAWKAIAPAVDSMHADALVTAARTAEQLGRQELAGEQLTTAVQRYPQVEFVLAAAIRRAWEQGDDAKAAELAARGRVSRGPYQTWYVEEFLTVFESAEEERILAAGQALVDQGASAWEIGNLAYGLAMRQRPAQAVSLNKLATAKGGEQLTRAVLFAGFIESWKGRDAALDYLTRVLPESMHLPATAMLYQYGRYDLALALLPDPEGLSGEYREFGWLMRLIVWLANDHRPGDLAQVFAEHYRAAGDHYRAAGRLLLGLCTEDDLLALAQTPKAVCEISYYLGLAARMRGDIPAAVRWYRICLETGQSDNSEYAWASDELSWWSKAGLSRRLPLPAQALALSRELSWKSPANRQ